MFLFTFLVLKVRDLLAHAPISNFKQVLKFVKEELIDFEKSSINFFSFENQLSMKYSWCKSFPNFD